MPWMKRPLRRWTGVECWIVDALRYTPHPSHAHLARALEWIARVKPKRAILTNMHVDLDYDRLRRELPPRRAAYDGMTLIFDPSGLAASAEAPPPHARYAREGEARLCLRLLWVPLASGP